MDSKWKIAFGVVGAGLILKTLSDKSNPSQDDGISLLESLSIGASNIVATVTGSKIPDFVNKMKPIAEQIKGTYGIAPIVTITQSALESGWGLSGLTKKANNLFGFTGDSWAKEGKSVIYMPTHEHSPFPPDKIQYFTKPGDIISKEPAAGGGSDLLVNRPFRSYPTWYDSVADWANLMKASRYTKALAAAKAGDVNAFAREVAAAGYATEPDYAQQLVSVSHSVASVAV